MKNKQQNLVEITYTRAKSKYGDILPERVKKRIDKELKILEKFSNEILSSMSSLEKIKKIGLLVIPRTKITNSFVFYLLGLSNVNPLPRHTYCPKCHTFYWGKHEKTKCEVCGEHLIEDGYTLPFEICEIRDDEFLKFDYSCAYHIVTNKGQVRTCEHSLLKLANLLNVSQEDIDNIDVNKDINNILNCLDESYYSKNYKNSHICNHRPFIGISDLGSELLKTLQEEYQVKDFDGLVKLCSMLHGTSVYDANEENLIDINNPNIDDTICSREDLFNFLIDQQFSKEDATLMCRETRIGKLSSLSEQKLLDANVDQKYIEYMRRVRYLFYKGYVVSHLKVAFVLAKIFLENPLRYYLAYFKINKDLLEKIPANPDYFKLLFDTKDYEMEKIYLGIIDLMERGFYPKNVLETVSQ